MSTIDRKNTNNSITCANLILLQGNKVLLGLRHNTGWMDGCYHLVCGGIEEGETALEAAVREAEEESGIVVKEEDLHFHAVVEKVHAAQRHILFFFLAKRWEGTVVNKEPHKCQELAFFDINNLPDNMIPYVRKMLVDLAEGNTEHYYTTTV